jgi:hypothetical protein
MLVTLRQRVVLQGISIRENNSDIFFFLEVAASYLIGVISGKVAKAQATKAGLAGEWDWSLRGNYLVVPPNYCTTIWLTSIC